MAFFIRQLRRIAIALNKLKNVAFETNFKIAQNLLLQALERFADLFYFIIQ